MSKPVSQLHSSTRRAAALPFQLQAFRAGAWAPVSMHHTQETANRARGVMSRCQPQNRENFRVIARTDPRFIHS